MADVTRTNLEEGVGERGDDVVVALDQGEALFTDTVSFFSLLNLVMVMMIKKMRVTMYHCKFSLSPQMPLYDFFDEPDPLGLSIAGLKYGDILGMTQVDWVYPPNTPRPSPRHSEA